MTFPMILVASPEERRIDEVTCGRNEGEERPCHDPGRRQGERHPQERLRRRRVEVLGRLEEPRVDLLERDVDRERMKGKKL